MQMEVGLKVIEGKQTGTLIPLNREKFLIGREEDCQLRPNSDLVSRHHCVIAVDDFTVRIRDLGSTNGTFVNDQRITTQVVLKQGDLVRIGKLAFEMQIRKAKEAPVVKVPEPVAIDYTQPASPGGETLTDFVIPQQLLDTPRLDAPTAMFGGDTTISTNQPAPQPAAPPAKNAPRPVAQIPLRLPDPSEIVAPTAPVPASATAAKPAAAGNPAADIIRQYMQRRPQ